MHTNKGSLVFGVAIFALSLANLIVESARPKASATDAVVSASGDNLQLGNFSVSFAVKDLQVSQAFYEKLDFRPIAGDSKQNWIILQNGTTTIGLFQGMIDKNMLTFNPGWNHQGEALPKFQDVRDLQATLKERGLTPVQEAEAGTTGPASFLIVDPDGNPILFDQHVPKPR